MSMALTDSNLPATSVSLKVITKLVDTINSLKELTKMSKLTLRIVYLKYSSSLTLSKNTKKRLD